MVHYLEVVANDVDATVKLYETAHGVEFGPEVADLGNARVASQSNGTLVGVRKPMASHESPIMRTYLAVENIEDAVKRAEASGAMVAYPPTRQGDAGMFAIVIMDNVQHGFWQA